MTTHNPPYARNMTALRLVGLAFAGLLVFAGSAAAQLPGLAALPAAPAVADVLAVQQQASTPIGDAMATADLTGAAAQGDLAAGTDMLPALPVAIPAGAAAADTVDVAASADGARLDQALTADAAGVQSVALPLHADAGLDGVDAGAGAQLDGIAQADLHQEARATNPAQQVCETVGSFFSAVGSFFGDLF